MEFLKIDILHVIQACCRFLGLNFTRFRLVLMGAECVQLLIVSAAMLYQAVNVVQLIFETSCMRHFCVNSRFKNNWDLDYFCRWILIILLNSSKKEL